jgi:hypothetical protein
LNEARVRVGVLDKTAQVTDRVKPLPCYFEDNGLVLSYLVADTAISFRYAHSARKDSTRVVFELRALDKNDYRDAKSLLNAVAPSDLPLTEERHDW